MQAQHSALAFQSQPVDAPQTLAPELFGELQHDDADLEAFVVDLTLPARVLAEAAPAVCEPAAYARLGALGLTGRVGVVGTGLSSADALCVEAVIFGGRRWRRARDLDDQRGAVAAFLFGARDADDEIIDVVAWDPESDRVATLAGAIGALGVASALGFRIEPPFVRETIRDWLGAGRDGVFIVDERLAGRELEGVTIAAPDIQAAERLRARLAPHMRSRPQIIVSTKARAA